MNDFFLSFFIFSMIRLLCGLSLGLVGRIGITVFTRIQENYARLEVRLSGGKTE